MFPFRNILFPDDSSVNAEAALKYATAFAQHGHGRVVSLSVQDAKEIGQAAIVRLMSAKARLRKSIRTKSKRSGRISASTGLQPNA